MVGLIYCKSGGGKTVNSTLVKAQKRNLLMCSDNSSIVLENFKRDNLDIEKITHCVKSRTNPNDSEYFLKRFDSLCDTGKYSNIIIDNLSDIFDMWILELDEVGNSKDKRQDYQLVYQNLKRLVRKATMVGCNVIFTAWLDISEITTADGERAVRYAPKLPNKILDNVCGLCNVIAYVDTTEDKNGKKLWFYRLEGNNSLYAKDQLYCRKVCKPENIFEQEVKSK